MYVLMVICCMWTLCPICFKSLSYNPENTQEDLSVWPSASSVKPIRSQMESKSHFNCDLNP